MPEYKPRFTQRTMAQKSGNIGATDTRNLDRNLFLSGQNSGAGAILQLHAAGTGVHQCSHASKYKAGSLARHIGLMIFQLGSPISGRMPDHRAATPRSWLRIRIASSTFVRKILPSPIFPVAAVCRMAVTAASTRLSFITDSILILGNRSTEYSWPRYISVCPFCRP